MKERSNIVELAGELLKALLQPALAELERRDRQMIALLQHQGRQSRQILNLLRERSGEGRKLSPLELADDGLEVARQRRRVLEQWEAACAAAKKRGTGRDKATKRFMDRLRRDKGLRICRETLYRRARCWRKAGLAGLVDGRSERAAAIAADAAPPPAAPAPLADPQWIDLNEASRRSGLNIGHLRSLCLHRYAARGLARKVRAERGGRGLQLGWEVSEAADVRFRPRSKAVRTGVKSRSKGRRGDN